MPNFNGGDLKEYPGSEVSTTANETNQDGELEYGHMPTSDEFAKTHFSKNNVNSLEELYVDVEKSYSL